MSEPVCGGESFHRQRAYDKDRHGKPEKNECNGSKADEGFGSGYRCHSESGRIFFSAAADDSNCPCGGYGL